MKQTRVLIVDDAPEVRAALSTLLPVAAAAAGAEVEVVGEAEDGKGAVELTVALRPDVVLIDLAMPGMDGYAATRAIKAKRPVTRVVVLTVHDDPQSRIRAHEAGADQFVEKGIPITALMEAMGCIKRKELQQ